MDDNVIITKIKKSYLFHNFFEEELYNVQEN